MCNCGATRNKKSWTPPNSFLVRCLTCSSPLLDLTGTPQPVNLISILADRDTILYWIGQGYDITFINPDDRAVVLLAAS